MVRDHDSAIQKYSPQPYPGRIVLFHPTEQMGESSNGSAESLAYLETLAADGVEVCSTPGSHATICKGPGAGVIANWYATKSGVVRPPSLSAAGPM